MEQHEPKGRMLFRLGNVTTICMHVCMYVCIYVWMGVWQWVARGNIQEISYIPQTEEHLPFGLMLCLGNVTTVCVCVCVCVCLCVRVHVHGVCVVCVVDSACKNLWACTVTK